MVPLDDEATTRVLAWDVGEGRSMSLRHALIHRRPGLWGDHPRRPRSVVLVREAGGLVTKLSGSAYDLYAMEILATNGRVHQPAIRALAESWPGT